MDSSANQQAYDRGHTIFSPDGRLYQVEYAREAVERGSPSVGVVADDGVVLAARKRVRSPLLEAGTVEKIHRIDDHLAIASAGHAADARQLVDVARREAQRHRLRYGEPIDAELLAKRLADHIQEHTQTGGSRPYGVALLVAGVDPDGTEGTQLYEVDPSGTPYGWRAVAVGNGGRDVRQFLEDRLGDGESASGDLQQGTATALEALAATTDEPELTPETVDVWTLEAGESETAASSPITQRTGDDLASLLAELELD
ncbi:archaeal proteasome endopeptidase complex subunit alpha [Halopiger aswanensis]|uniref:Proteasome subunit alpha n=1 Tax=Halopiger aswanensis TaxID=148449 RepID=A0A3R7GKX5_9EURY|nr:archaeal proteasome endopeptidase complex subunit alpha [Halopiger aswanensis]RKD97640.1 proteasome alpha subunit [Halopiger aswanensis]